jgi:transcriptional regulator with XRE-family HTH domain
MLSRKRFAEILGSNIKKARTKKELTQEQLAALCGFYRTYINLLETARRVPSSYNVHRIAVALKIQVDDLYSTTT